MPSESILQKRCNVCEHEFPATTEFFHRRKASNDGLCYTCKECSIARTKQNAADNPERVRESARRYYTEHLEESRAYHLEYYQRNADIIRQRARDWYWDNREDTLEYARQYYQDNREVLIAKGVERERRNPEQARARKQRYIERNPERRKQSANAYAHSEKGRVGRQRRRARKDGLPDTLTGEQWADCLEYWGYACAVCEHSDEIHADHFIALALDDCPGTIATNIIPLCRSCNSSKRDKRPDQWLMKKYPDIGGIILADILEYFVWIKGK